MILNRTTRRKFLRGLSIFGLMVLSTPVLAQTGSLMSGAPLGAFNGGRSQVNFNFLGLQGSGEFPFINGLKTGQAWAQLKSGGGYNDAPTTPNMLDANQYPFDFTGTVGFQTIWWAPTVMERPGNYIVMLFGEGTAQTTGSGTLTSSAGVWTRFVVNTNSSDGRIVFNINTRGVSSYISNAAMFHSDDEVDWLQGKVFGRQFLNVLKQANFGVLRFLNWQVNNTTNCTTFSTLKSVSHFSWACSEHRSNIYAGLTTNVGNAYSIVGTPPLWGGLVGGKPVDKQMVTIVFNTSATQSGTCSLSVGGSDAINILNEASGALSIGTDSYPIGGNFQSMATCVYDAKLVAWIKQGGDVAANSQGINAGCPIEIMLRLCAEVGAHPWFCMPAFALSPMTDFVTKLSTMTYLYSSWMIARFETPNEMFNTTAGFYQTGYAIALTTAYIANNSWSGSSNFYDVQGMWGSTIGQAVNAIYGGSVNGTRYQIIIGVQTVLFESTAGANSNDPRLTAAQYKLHGPSQVGYTQTEAYLWATHVCGANYFAPSQYGTGAEITAANAYAAAAGNAPLQLSIATTYMNTVAGAASGFNLAATAARWPFLYAWAQKFTNSGGLKLKMCAYEGGYSPDLIFAAGTNVNNLRNSSKFVVDAGKALIGGTFVSGDTVNGAYKDFTDAGGEFPSLFMFAGGTDAATSYTFGLSLVWAVWGANVYAPTPSQGTAIIAYNH